MSLFKFKFLSLLTKKLPSILQLFYKQNFKTRKSEYMKCAPKYASLRVNNKKNFCEGGTAPPRPMDHPHLPSYSASILTPPYTGLDHKYNAEPCTPNALIRPWVSSWYVRMQFSGSSSELSGQSVSPSHSQKL